jgi:NADPH:quinone reductase-like Zn-dependent oxidoreductase
MTIPSTMRAAAFDRVGDPSVLAMHTLPVPTIDAGEVLIAVHTAGVGGWDADMRGGWWPGRRPPFPIVLGSDGSGRIAAVGSRVRRFAVGDRVYAHAFNNAKGGFYAEYVAIDARDVAHLPSTLDLRRAGAVPATGLTALQGIEALAIRKGETVLIHGAGGGVGSLAVQFARLRGARVLATASGADGLAFVRRMGAHAAVDGRRDSIAAAARELAPDGLDTVLALAGGPALTEALDAVRAGGRLAYPNGVEPAPRKRRGLTVLAYDGIPGVREFQRLTRAVEAARLKVPIAAAYALADAARAHERLAAGHILGKIVLKVR